MTEYPRRRRLEIEVESEEEAEALLQALLRARATELAEVRRREVRLGAGYGDETTRDSMTEEGRRAAARHEMLGRLIDALRTGE
jgi:hypothetical protein